MSFLPANSFASAPSNDLEAKPATAYTSHPATAAPQKSDAMLIKPLLSGLIDTLMAQKIAVAGRDLKGIERQQQQLQSMWSRLQRVSPTAMGFFPVECQAIQRLAQESMDLLSHEYQRVSTVLNAVTCNTYQASGQANLPEWQSQDCQA
jgi:uncharacterized membrane protein YheB (UPF0754 family)